MKKFNAKDYIADLNNVKTALEINITFKKAQLISGLKGCQLPYNGNFLQALKKCGIVECVNRKEGLYHFPFKNPFTVETLDKVYKTYSESARKYNQKYLSTTKHISTRIEKMDKQQAIEFLKSLGYKIQKPILTYEEI